MVTQLTIDPLARRVGDTTPTAIGRVSQQPRLVAALATNKHGPVPLTQRHIVIDVLANPLGVPAGPGGPGMAIGAVLWCHRLAYAQRRGPMPITRRYTPELAPAESCLIGMNFDAVIPPGVGIDHGALMIFTNTVPRQPVHTPQADTGLFVVGDVQVQERTLYARITVSDLAEGQDFQFWWTAADTDGNFWPRSAMALCAATS